MKRFVLAVFVIIGVVACAAPAPSATLVPAASATATAPATKPTPTVWPTIGHVSETVMSSLVSGKDSALVIGYLYSKNHLRRVDLATGQDTAVLDIGRYPVYTLSPDGSQMAVFNYANENAPDEGMLELVDTHTLRTRTIEGISFPVLPNTVFFSPDAAHLLVTSSITDPAAFDTPVTGFSLALVDLAQGSVATEASLDFSPDYVRFSPDGKTIAIFGPRYGSGIDTEPGLPQVALLDAADLHTLWTAPVEGLLDGWYPMEGTTTPDLHAGIMWTPVTEFSADATKLYIVHADVDKLTTVDLAAHAITTVDITQKKAFLDTLMGLGAGTAHAKAVKGTSLNGSLSTDGSKLYVTGNAMDYTVDSSFQFDFTNTSLGLRVIDLSSGALLKTIDAEISSMSASADGAYLFLVSYDDEGSPSTQVLDSSTYEVIATVPGFEVYPAPITLADGRQAFPAIQWRADSRTTLGLVDAATFDLLSSWVDDASAGWVLPPQ